jgi:hypothetical protein
LSLLNKSDVEAARLHWFAAVLNSKREVPVTSQPILSIDPLMRRNIDLLRRTSVGEPRPAKATKNSPPYRMMLLGDCARMRLAGRHEEAITILEDFMKKFENHSDYPTSTWSQGKVVLALMHLDASRPNTAVRIARELRTSEPRHPHVRSLVRILHELGHIDAMGGESTGITMLIDSGGDWMKNWPLVHTVQVPPRLSGSRSLKHAVKANVWITHSPEQSVSKYYNKRSAWKRIPYNSNEKEAPLGLYLHLYGIIATIGGMPVDLGLPAGFDIEALENRGLL